MLLIFPFLYFYFYIKPIIIDPLETKLKLPKITSHSFVELGKTIPLFLGSESGHLGMLEKLKASTYILPSFRLLQYKITPQEHKKDELNLNPSHQQIKHSSNWSGAVWKGTDLRTVSATWRIQPVKEIVMSENQLATQWIGLGGCGAQPLIQAGTDGWVMRGGRKEYKVWFELIQPHVDIHPFFLTNFPVHEFDIIHMAIEYIPGKSASCRFFIWNISKLMYTTFEINDIGELPPVNTAEWIVEKVLECPLAQQEYALFMHAHYGHTNFSEKMVTLNRFDASIEWYQVSDGQGNIRLSSYPHPHHDAIVFRWINAN